MSKGQDSKTNINLYPNLNDIKNNGETSSRAHDGSSKSDSSDSEEITKTEYKTTMLFQWIDKYDGSNNKLNEFIINTDAVFKLASKEQKPILLAYAKKQLTGRAKMIVSTKCINSWNKLKEFLIESFSPRQTIDELILESQTLKQLANESIMDFTLRLDILDSNFIKAINFEHKESPTAIPGLLKMKDNICLRAFLAGVLPMYQNLLTLKEPKNYQEASYFCVKIENENKINRSHEQLTKKQNFCNFCKKSNHTSANCYKKLNQSINANHNENKFGKSEANIRNTSLSSQSGSKLFCNYCKKTNHEIKDCRKLKWKREQEKQKSNSSSSGRIQLVSEDSETLSSSHSDSLNSSTTAESAAAPRAINLIKAEFSQ